MKCQNGALRLKLQVTTAYMELNFPLSVSINVDHNSWRTAFTESSELDPATRFICRNLWHKDHANYAAIACTFNIFFHREMFSLSMALLLVIITTDLQSIALLKARTDGVTFVSKNRDCFTRKQLQLNFKNLIWCFKKCEKLINLLRLMLQEGIRLRHSSRKNLWASEFDFVATSCDIGREKNFRDTQYVVYNNQNSTVNCCHVLYLSFINFKTLTSG